MKNKKYVFSDLVSILEYLEEAESLKVIPENTFVLKKTNEFEFRGKGPIQYDSANDAVIDDDERIFNRLFNSYKLAYNDTILHCFESEGKYFATLSDILNFLKRIGLEYRPELGLPGKIDSYTRSLVRGDLRFWKEEVMIKGSMSVLGWHCSVSLSCYRKAY